MGILNEQGRSLEQLRSLRIRTASPVNSSRVILHALCHRSASSMGHMRTTCRESRHDPGCLLSVLPRCQPQPDSPKF